MEGAYLTRVGDNSKRLALYIGKTILIHENVLKAKAYLKDGCNEKVRASRLISGLDWNGSVEASQHCIGHSIKSLFLLVGLKHPFEHEPTKEFDKVIDKLK